MQPRTLVELLDRLGTAMRSLVLADDGTSLPYARIPELAGAAATRLRRRGVGPGDAVGLLAPSGLDYVTGFFGIVAAGAAVVPLPDPAVSVRSTHLVAQIDRFLAATGARALYVTRPYGGIAALVARQRPGLEVVAHEEPASAAAACPVDPSRPAVLQCNSGPLLRPRPIVLTHRALMSASRHGTAALGLGPIESVALWSPLAFELSIGILLACLHIDSDLHLFSPTGLLRRPGRVLGHLAGHRVRVVAGGNLPFRLLTDKATTPGMLGGLRCALFIGEHIDPDVLTSFAQRHALPRGVVRSAYGMAEAGLISITAAEPTVLNMTSEGIAERDGWATVSAGTPLPHLTVRILDDAGRAVPEGMVGEVEVAGDSVAGSPLRTGDLAALRNGELYLCGRNKAMIIVHGRNFFAEDVQAITDQILPNKCRAIADTRPDHEQVIVHIPDTPDFPDLAQQIHHAVAQQTGLRAVHCIAVPQDQLTEHNKEPA